MSVIEISGLNFSYSGEKHPVQALKDLNLKVEDGEFLCIIGPSGCGKSTLLRLLAGLERPDGGTVKIGGKTVSGPGADRMIVFQDYTLFPWLTAEENISFALHHAQKKPKKQAAELAREFLERVGMGMYADFFPRQLSGGMQQRVAIARALAMDTEILLLDEPFGALDAKIREELQRLLEKLWSNPGGKKKTVVFVTHDIDEAVRLGDRVAVMCPGRIYATLEIDRPRPKYCGSAGGGDQNGSYSGRLHVLLEDAASEERI